jgi:hypothetical protein
MTQNEASKDTQTFIIMYTEHAPTAVPYVLKTSCVLEQIIYDFVNSTLLVLKIIHTQNIYRKFIILCHNNFQRQTSCT